MWSELDKLRGWMEVLLRGVEDGWVRPHVDRTFRYDQAGEAHAYLEARKSTGKVVLIP
jgi:NADPH:quinone reductase-like Zn-dependent oxidoreductase